MTIKYQSGDILCDRYQIVKVLGQGGVAVTYEATDTDTNTSVAIKVISLKQLENWKQVELFQREAEVLKKLNHPQIPQYLDYFDLETETDKSFYIVQQLAPGKSLFDLVESGWRTTETEVKKIAQKVLNILSYLHSLEPPVIHRDIKPNNLIRSDDGTIYLVDFGAVQHTYYNTLMQGSTVVGTYGYMAPEQFRGKALPATDLYSLGATILYLLTHRSPSELPQDTLKLDFRSSVNISESFADWLEKILEPDIEDRFNLADVALKELLASTQVKQKKVFTGIGVGVLCLTLAWSVASYKWFFLSSLGFYPSNLCSSGVALNFLKQGGNVNWIQNSEIVNILACTIRENETKTLEHFLNKIHPHNLDEIINKQLITSPLLYSKTKSTLFYEAINYRRNKAVKLLIDYGADTKKINSVRKGSKDDDINFIQSLVDSGLNINDAVDILYDKGNIKDECANEIIEIFISNDSSINTKGLQGQTPLMFAINLSMQNQNFLFVKRLIENGANVNIVDAQENSPLHIAISLGFNSIYNQYTNLDVIKLLINSGANVNYFNKSQKTPLNHLIETEHWLANSQKKIIATNLLIEAGANVNIKDKSGNSPLHKSVLYRYKNIVKILLEADADVNTKNMKGQTPLSIAVFNLDSELVPLLLSHDAKVDFMSYANMKKIHGTDSLEEYQKRDEFLKQYTSR